MAKHHSTKQEPGWRKGIFINGFGASCRSSCSSSSSASSSRDGAWVIIVLVPVMVWLLMRLNKQYENEARRARSTTPQRGEPRPILRRHVVLVFVDRLDQSTARAIQYARALMPDEMRAVHIAVDRPRGEQLAEEWRRLGLSPGAARARRLPRPPRRPRRRSRSWPPRPPTATPRSRCSLPAPRVHSRFWHRLLHDRTADEIAEAVGQAPARQRDDGAVPARRRPRC